MVSVRITLDTQRACKKSFKEITRNGKIIWAAGIINSRWEEFSALDLAREVDLQGIKWDSLQDDTPGSLTIMVEYPSLTIEEVESRLSKTKGVEDYEVFVEEEAAFA